MAGVWPAGRCSRGDIRMTSTIDSAAEPAQVLPDGTALAEEPTAEKLASAVGSRGRQTIRQEMTDQQEMTAQQVEQLKQAAVPV